VHTGPESEGLIAMSTPRAVRAALHMARAAVLAAYVPDAAMSPAPDSRESSVC